MIYLSLGTNLGNRIVNLQNAIDFLVKNGFLIYKKSIVLETKAILPLNAPSSWDLPYFNMMLVGSTKLSPQEFLQVIKMIEISMGRPINSEKWSPRIIDIDIVSWNNFVIQQQDLEIPHPELINRKFWQFLLHNLGHEQYLTSQIPDLISTKIVSPKIMGIVNITKDSFSDGGLYHNLDHAYSHITKLHQEGASAIDLGAQSTRPGAEILGAKHELSKLDPLLERVFADQDLKNIKISLDTFWPEVALYLAKKYPIAWLNDVSGALDNSTLASLQALGTGVCVMHSLTIPASKTELYSSNLDIIATFKAWSVEKITTLMAIGFTPEKIIVDPGIGFGKHFNQNISLLKNSSQYRDLGVATLIGHSRKSFIGKFANVEDVSTRDCETVAMSLAIKDSVDWLRVHNVDYHMRSMVAFNIAQKDNNIRL